MYLKQQHFYYGAILSAIIEYNPDASMVLVQKDDETRKIFNIETNKSQSCRIFFKYATEKKTTSNSWLFIFSQNDTNLLEQCYIEKIPTFIYLLCVKENLKESEIEILKLDEFRGLNKSSFTIKLPKRSRSFFIARSKSPITDYPIPRNRIESNFDKLINEVIEDSNGYYLPKCKHCFVHQKLTSLKWNNFS